MLQPFGGLSRLLEWGWKETPEGHAVADDAGLEVEENENESSRVVVGDSVCAGVFECIGLWTAIRPVCRHRDCDQRRRAHHKGGCRRRASGRGSVECGCTARGTGAEGFELGRGDSDERPGDGRPSAGSDRSQCKGRNTAGNPDYYDQSCRCSPKAAAGARRLGAQRRRRAGEER